MGLIRLYAEASTTVPNWAKELLGWKRARVGDVPNPSAASSGYLPPKPPCPPPSPEVDDEVPDWGKPAEQQEGGPKGEAEPEQQEGGPKEKADGDDPEDMPQEGCPKEDREVIDAEDAWVAGGPKEEAEPEQQEGGPKEEADGDDAEDMPQEGGPKDDRVVIDAEDARLTMLAVVKAMLGWQDASTWPNRDPVGIASLNLREVNVRLALCGFEEFMRLRWSLAPNIIVVQFGSGRWLKKVVFHNQGEALQLVRVDYLAEERGSCA